MRRQKFYFIIAILFSGFVGYIIGTSKIKADWKNFQPHLEITSKQPPASISHIDFSPMWVVLQHLESEYYDKQALNPQKVLNGAISGMVSSLDDPYTVYLPPAENNDFKEVMAGKFEGIGAELGMKEKQIIVVAPLDGSPAKQAGIRGGDAIIKVDNQTTYGWTIAEAVDKIRGPKGSKVTLLIAREGEKEAKTITIMRDTITIKSITSWVKPVKDVENIKMTSTLQSNKDKKVAYIRLSQFGDSTNQEWVNVTNEVSLAMKRDPDIQGVIFDLRNNPGGYLNDAVFIASEFLKDGTVVMQEDREGNRMKMDVTRQGLLTSVPVYVLINKGSASASEIVAGALSDHGRAKLIGEVSFGKGTVQAAEELGGGSGLHVTIAKWLTPNGTWVHQKGLTPQIEVKLDDKDPSHDTQLERAVEELVR